jgi:hypothetical protein
MGRRPRSGLPSRPRRGWRCCRRTLISLGVIGAGALLYLTQIGFPGFLQGPILQRAQARGIHIQAERLRLDWYRGVVAESVTLAEANPSGGPELSFTEVSFRPKFSSLWKLSLRLADLELRGGRLAFALDDVDPPENQFAAHSIAADLRWLPDDQLEIRRLTARTLGTRLELSGVITHASRFASRVEPSDESPPALEVWRANLQRILRLSDLTEFSDEPQLHMDVAGDARDLSTLTAHLRFQASDATTPWGKLDALRGRGQLNQATGTNAIGLSLLTVDFFGFETPWTAVDQGHLQLQWSQAVTNPIPAHVDWRLALESIHSPWGTSPGLQLTIQAQPGDDPSTPLVGDLVLTSDALLGGFARADTNRLTARVSLDPETFLPTRADWRLDASHITFPHGSARELHLTGQMAHAADRPAADTSAWAWWAWLEPFTLKWQGAIEELVVDSIVSDRVEVAGHWRAPTLELTELRADILGCALGLRGQMDVDTGAVHASTRLDLAQPALERLSSLRPDSWLQHVHWSQPPSVEAQMDLVWPRWTQELPDWRTELLPTLRIDGAIQGQHFGYRDLVLDQFSTRFSVSNAIVKLRDCVVLRPEGTLEFSYTEDLRSRDFHLDLRSGVDPHAFEPLLGIREDLVVDLFFFRAPPRIDAELWGSWYAPAKVEARATVEAADFSIREEDIDLLSARVNVADGALHAVDVRVRIGDEWVEAPDVGFDFATRWLSFTNVTARLDPQRVGRAIGPETAKDLSPYEFAQPPLARVDGGVNVSDTRHADMRFEVAGGPFHYWRFDVPEVRSHVHWRNESLVISNLHAPFYQGTLEGVIHVEIPHKQEARVRLQALVNRANFNLLIADLFTPPNRLEGLLNLNLHITDAAASDPQSWQGFGRADLRDGYLWDIPLFGLVSPVLDSVVPGLGRSRINGATATFHVTNSIVHTGDLELRAPLFRLAYRGAADLSGRINARVEARLLRDAWVVGPLVSLIFSPLTKLFEYQVTGTLERPEMELIYIPKPLQLPLNPIGTIREMIEDERPPPPSF